MNPETQSSKFHTRNRTKLRSLLRVREQYEGLTIIAGGSFVQISSDRAYSFEQEASFLYLTGINEPGLILVFDQDQEYLIVPERSESRIAFEGSVDTIELTEISGIQIIVSGKEGWSRLEGRLNAVQHVATLTSQYIYIEQMDFFINPSIRYLIDTLKSKKQSLEFLDIREELTSLRVIKSPYEIKMIERAIKETYKLFKLIEKKRNKATYEYDLLAEINRTRTKLQLQDAYEPIIASGIHTVTMHHFKSNGFIDKKGMLLLDIGLKYNGYSADISRTISFSPNKRQREVYDAVVSIQDYAFSLLKPGIPLKEYEASVTRMTGEKLCELGVIDSVSDDNIRRHYPHLASHFLGIDVHDVGARDATIEPGMVLTIEPGIYIPSEGIGIRIEDDVLITPDGNRNLSNKLPKNIASLTIEA